MKHIVIDLEMNKIARSSEARKICKSEIIEIGAVMLDENLQEIGNFRTYVKPEYNDKIAAEIRNLTGITYAMVANAPVFREAFRMFTNWCLGTGDEVTIYAWSDSDYNQVVKEILLKEYELSDEEHGLIDTEWTDFQNEFDAHIGFERRISLNSPSTWPESISPADSTTPSTTPETPPTSSTSSATVISSRRLSAKSKKRWIRRRWGIRWGV